jgi:multidrug resistance efflux pump
LNNGQLSITGRVEADETRIAAMIPGKVQNVFVREGETVKTGQQLIALDDSAFRKQLAWLDKLIEKGDREKTETEKLLAAMQIPLKKAKDSRKIGRSVAYKSNGKVIEEKTAQGTVRGVYATDSAAVSSVGLKLSDKSNNQIARQADNFAAKQLNELNSRQADQRQRLEQLTKQAEAEVDSGFAQQKQILTEARQAENKALAKYNAFPLKLMGKGKDTTVDDLFDVKEKELEKLHDLQKQSIAETAKINQSALNEGFELQRESIQDLEQGRAMIGTQLQLEKMKIEDLLRTKQNELGARLSKYDNPDFMEKTLRDLESVQADKQSLMVDLSKDQLTARLALIDTEQTKARATREEIQGKIESCSIKSPVDGICVSRAVQPGELVAPGLTLLKVADIKSAYLRAFIPFSELGRITIGQKAEIHIDATAQKALRATVTEIDQHSTFNPQNVYSEDDRLKQQYGIKLSFENVDGLAKPGMSGQATISTANNDVP